MVCARVWSWCCHSSLSLLPLLGALGLKQVLDRPKVSCQKAGEYRNRSSTAGWEWTGGSGSGMGITGVILRHREVREPMLQTHPHRQPSTPGICWLLHESGVWWEGQLWPFSSLARSGSGWARKGWRESGFLRGVVYAALITGPGTYQGWVRTPSLCLQPSFGPFQELAGLREFFVALGSVLVLFFPSNMRAVSEVPKYCFVLNHLQGWWPTTLDQMFIWLCLWAGISSIGMPACVISWTQELFLGPKGIKIVCLFVCFFHDPSSLVWLFLFARRRVQSPTAWLLLWKRGLFQSWRWCVASKPELPLPQRIPGVWRWASLTSEFCSWKVCRACWELSIGWWQGP